MFLWNALDEWHAFISGAKYGDFDGLGEHSWLLAQAATAAYWVATAKMSSSRNISRYQPSIRAITRPRLRFVLSTMAHRRAL